jgi:hypothetical protein
LSVQDVTLLRIVQLVISSRRTDFSTQCDQRGMTSLRSEQFIRRGGNELRSYEMSCEDGIGNSVRNTDNGSGECSKKV